jgi:hypothetical protein
MSKILEKPAAYKSPLHEMTQTTPTCLWNDSATLSELSYSIEHGAVGATCNPVIVLEALKKEAHLWNDRIRGLAAEFPTATEDEIGWKLVEEISATRAKLLLPAFEKHKGRNGRLSIQTDPHFYRNAAALLEQALRFDALAPNMIVKIPATRAGIAAIEEATYRGISINATVSFCLPQAFANRRFCGNEPRLWEDFDLLLGPSHERVTAYAACALLHTNEERSAAGSFPHSDSYPPAPAHCGLADWLHHVQLLPQHG